MSKFEQPKPIEITSLIVEESLLKSHLGVQNCTVSYDESFINS